MFVSVYLGQDSLDGSVCSGTIVSFTCTTTSSLGLLRWQTNGVTLFNLNSISNVGDNATMSGSEFVFTDAQTISGARVYTSTVSLNTAQITSIQCSDGLELPSRTVEIGSKS